MKNGTLVPILGALISVRGWFDSGFGRLPKLMTEVATLAVPLLVEIGAGPNWETAH